MKAKIFTGASRTGKTRVAKMIAEYTVGPDKTFILPARRLHGDVIHDIPFLLHGMPDEVELLIVDDCPIDFDYSFFFPVVSDTQKEGDFKFRITRENRGECRKEILVPQVIFTTEKLDEKWHMFSFNARFDVVEFPLSGLIDLSGNMEKRFMAKVDDTTAFGCSHHYHSKHRVYVDGLTYEQAKMIEGYLNDVVFKYVAK